MCPSKKPDKDCLHGIITLETNGETIGKIKKWDPKPKETGCEPKMYKEVVRKIPSFD